MNSNRHQDGRKKKKKLNNIMKLMKKIDGKSRGGGRYSEGTRREGERNRGGEEGVKRGRG